MRTATAEVDRHGAAPTYRLTMSGAKLPLARPLGIGGRRFTPAAQNVSAALRSKPIKHSSATTCDRKSKTHTVGTHSPINHSISTSVVTILKLRCYNTSINKQKFVLPGKINHLSLRFELKMDQILLDFRFSMWIFYGFFTPANWTDIGWHHLVLW